MNFQLAKKFEYLKDSLLNAITNIHSFDNVFESGRRNSIKKITLLNTVIVIKSFKTPNLINQFVYNFFRKSKAQRSYEYGVKLLNLGINTPTPIAYLEKNSILRLRESFYTCEFVDCDLTYRDLINQPNYPDYENILRAFTKFTYTLHKKGVQFLDHSPGNTLIIKRGENYIFFLVDLNRMKFGTLNFYDRMKNFSRLTPKKEMIEIMSDEYAKLSDESFDKIFDAMWQYTQLFQEKFQRKKRFKKRFLGRK